MSKKDLLEQHGLNGHGNPIVATRGQGVDEDGRRWHQDDEGFVVFDEPENELQILDLSTVEPKEVKWLWTGRFPLGKTSLIVGDPGRGKSFLTLYLAAQVSTGGKWPDGAGCAPLGQVLLFGAEDDVADTVVPRLIAAGADRTKVKAVQCVKLRDDKGEYERSIDLQRDIPRITETAKSMQDVKLIIIDPVSCFMGDTDSHKNADVRATLAPLAELAAAQGIAVILVSHLRKGEGMAIHRTMGSLAFVAAARAVMVVTADKEDTSRKLLLPVKNNIGNDKTGLAFKLSAIHTGGGIPCIEWIAGEVKTTADEAMAPPARKRGPDADATPAAIEFLKTTLADGPLPQSEIDKKARAADIAIRTLNRAKRELLIVSYRPERRGPWWWKLPDSHIAKQDATSELLGNHGNLGNVTDCIVVSENGEWSWDSDCQDTQSPEQPGNVTPDDDDDANRAFMEAADQDDF